MLPARRTLSHHRPSWVDPHDLWFVTICCQRPCPRPLTDEATCPAIRAALAQAQEAGRLELRLCTIMPDHLHMVARWSHARGLAREVIGLKRWLARRQGIVWQRDFFDHRLRSESEFTAKAQYVRLNPVRAGLVARPEDWPHTWSGR
jgi:REP element-mobilizing transposase RayT